MAQLLLENLMAPPEFKVSAEAGSPPWGSARP